MLLEELERRSDGEGEDGDPMERPERTNDAERAISRRIEAPWSYSRCKCCSKKGDEEEKFLESEVRVDGGH